MSPALSADVEQTINDVFDTNRRKGRYTYTADILLALFTNGDGLIQQVLSRTRPRFTERLVQALRDWTKEFDTSPQPPFAELNETSHMDALDCARLLAGCYGHESTNSLAILLAILTDGPSKLRTVFERNGYSTWMVPLLQEEMTRIGHAPQS
jgi:hypothetical protein